MPHSTLQVSLPHQISEGTGFQEHSRSQAVEPYRKRREEQQLLELK